MPHRVQEEQAPRNANSAALPVRADWVPEVSPQQPKSPGPGQEIPIPHPRVHAGKGGTGSGHKMPTETTATLEQERG